MISVSLSTSLEERHQTRFIPRQITSLEHLGKEITSHPWCPAILKDNYRRNANFIKAHYLALDFDEGLCLWDAVDMCHDMGLAAVVATTKSHQKWKKEAQPCDRFRIVFPLAREVTKTDDFKATWFHAWRIFNRVADRATKDPSRFFWPCTKVSYVNDGKAFPVIEGKPLETTRKIVPRASMPLAVRDRMVREGSTVGKRNAAVFFAAFYLFRCGWSSEQISDKISPMTSLDRDEVMRTINQAKGYIE